MKRHKVETADIPAAFLERMAGLLNEEYPAFLASLQQPAIIGLRVNTLKISTTDFQQKSLCTTIPVSWCPAGFSIPADQANGRLFQPGKHPYHLAGLYYLQEPSAMAVPGILAPLPGERVLDLAAAPGGKATHLAGLMQNTGILVANEVHSLRFRDLLENLERCGITNSIATQASPQTLADHFGEYFDRVLLDAPCSGEGMFRKGTVARREWKPNLVHSCAIRQSGILDSAARLVKVGGHLAYSTCTFSPEENEGVIAKFLDEHPEFDLEILDQPPGMSRARPDWIGLMPDNQLTQALRIWPHLALGEGHFVARLFKIDTSPGDKKRWEDKSLPATRKNTISRLNLTSTHMLDEFCRENLSITFDPSRLIQVGKMIFLKPGLTIDYPVLEQLQPGWMLGSVLEGRFNPSHALALAMDSSQVYHKLDLMPGDPRLSAYFSGETIPDAGTNAWVIICVDGFPVGWGKRVSHVIKNYYPHRLRHMN